jgi:alcohol dehydrogenase class IV
METYQGNWNYPNQIIAGVGRLSEIVELCQSKGYKHSLVVTDPGISILPFFEALQARLSQKGVDFSVYKEVSANPNESSVAGGVKQYKANKHDSIIAIGGGSAIDVAKAVALMVAQDRPLWDFEDVGDNWTRVNEEGIASVIAVPTTAGTGSEVGRASVITDSEKSVKKIIFHPRMLPELVILDPLVTKDLPPHITAATGLDALSHCIEALCSPSYHPMAEGIAIEGIRLIKNYLPVAYTDGQDLDARMNMLVASSMGATAFQKGLGAMHAVAHSIGAIYGAHHGLLNAILMPYVLIENLNTIKDKLSRVSRYLGLPGGDSLAFVNWVNQLRQEMSIPRTLSEIGVKEEDVPRIAAMSVVDPSAGGNPVNLSEDDYSRLILNAIRGVNGEVESGDFAM